jgi:3'(2'), 5'-bisphosphate nucleotidase
MSEKLLTHRAALTNIIRRISIQAGEIILEYYDGFKDMAPVKKNDGSPVTQADKDAEIFIEKHLKELMPNVPVIGEELYSNGIRPDLSQHDYYWLVDPLDGTRSFIRGEGNFTTNIALIHCGQPVLGVVYAPQKEEIYYGYFDSDTNEGHAYRYFEQSDNEKSIRTRKVPKKGLSVMTSGDYPNESKHQEFLKDYKVANITRCASSLKICAIANGKADLYARFGPTGEWDTAAGHAVLRAAGGDIRDISGNSLRYGENSKDIINPDFIAASNDFFLCMARTSQEG